MSHSAIAHRLSGHYAEKPVSYFVGARHDFVDLLPPDPSAQILEVGCGAGATGALALEQKKCARYVGIELMPEAATEARKVLSEVILGNIEEIALPAPPATFDALILSEVVEHLVDPWTALKRLAIMLKPGAIVLASSPNVANWKILRQLSRGRFDYTERGTMDRTHLRWFTPATYRELFEHCGYAVDRVYPIVPLRPHQKAVSTMLGGRDHLFYAQICLSAHLKS